MNLAHGLRREPAGAIRAAFSQQLRVHGVEMGWSEPLEWDGAQTRQDVRHDLSAVLDPGGSAQHRRFHRRQPGVEKELPERLFSRTHIGRGVERTLDLPQRSLRLALCGEPALHLLATILSPTLHVDDVAPRLAALEHTSSHECDATTGTRHRPGISFRPLWKNDLDHQRAKRFSERRRQSASDGYETCTDWQHVASAISGLADAWVRAGQWKCQSV